MTPGNAARAPNAAPEVVAPDGTSAAFDYDWIIVGSGCGGSVAALRLSEKGYRVAVIECGHRCADADYAASAWDLQRFVWAPRLGMRGVQPPPGGPLRERLAGSTPDSPRPPRGGHRMFFADRDLRPPGQELRTPGAAPEPMCAVR